MTFEGKDVRSMAPPIPFTFLPGIIQFAKEPSCATCIAPRIVRSKCPPLTIPKESLEQKKEEPGKTVIVYLLALIKSGVSGRGYRALLQ